MYVAEKHCVNDARIFNKLDKQTISWVVEFLTGGTEWFRLEPKEYMKYLCNLAVLKAPVFRVHRKVKKLGTSGMIDSHHKAIS